MSAPAQRPEPTDDEHRVIDFRPRVKKPPVHSPLNLSAASKSPPDNERSRPIDYRQRMMANLAAALVAVVLAAAGVWLFTTLNHMRQTQDCIMMGIRNCGDSNTPNS